MVDRFAGQTVLITGAGRGLGRAVALVFARLGTNLALCARSADQVAEVADAARALGAEALGEALDITDRPALEALVRRAEQRFGGVDVLINNAGVLQPVAPLWRADPAAWLRNIEINLGGAFLALRAVLPGMIERQRGAVVNVSSGVTRPDVRVRGWTAYSAAKAGLDQLTRVLAEELRPYQIQAIAFNPGMVDTAMQALIRGLPEADFGADQLARFRRAYAVGKVQPPELPARAIVWLASLDAAALSGEVLDIEDERALAGAAAVQTWERARPV